MKKSALFLVFVLSLFTAVSCTSDSTDPSQAASVTAAENNSSGSESEASIVSRDDSDIIEESQETFDFHGKELEKINELYEEYIRRHGDQKMQKLDLTPLFDVFTVVSIITGDEYYSLDIELGSIQVFNKDVVYNEQTLFETHIKNRDYLTTESIGIYRDYQTVLDEEFLKKYPVCCDVYEKEGVKVYAIRSAGLTHDYDIYFEIGGVYFGVRTSAYNYPNKIGVLRAKDEWKDQRCSNEALIELSDVTTDSSALIRALKEAVSACSAE